MNPIVTMSKGSPFRGIKPYPVLVTGCVVSKENQIMLFVVNDKFRKNPITNEYVLDRNANFTFNAFAVKINKALQDEIDRCGYSMPIDTIPERLEDVIVRRKTKENGKMESECPAFMSNWDPEAVECKDCAKAFQDEYAQCRRATQIEQEKKEEQAPDTITSEPVKPVTPVAAKEFKGFRAGSRAAVLLELLKTKKQCTLDEAADYIAVTFKIDKKFSMEGIKAYLGEWVKGKWSCVDQNFPFTIVIDNNVIKYQDK